MTDPDPLYALCRAFIEKHRISCPEATAEDRVYEHAPELVAEIAQVVGFFPNDDEDDE